MTRDEQEKLRVCFFIPEFSYGGAQKQCILLLNELQRRDDVELLLIRFRPGPQDHLLRIDRLRCEFVHVRSNFDPRAAIEARRLAVQFQADVLISWIRVCDIYAAIMRVTRPKFKWVLTQRNSTPAGGWLRSVRNVLGGRADAIAANSPGGVQWWQQRAVRCPVYLVDNIADPGRPAGSPRMARSILYVGRLESQKNVLTMVRAFSVVAQHHPDVKIWVCGDGTLRAEMESIAAAGTAADQIQFLGFRKDATELMSTASVLVSLSEYEGMPNVLMEGVRVGCAIVASAIPEHRGLLGEDYPLMVEHHHDVDEVVRVIVSAMDSSTVHGDLAHARDVLAGMAPEAVATQYMDIFRATAASQGRHVPNGRS
jgi:glycosyltransferase involved in cell wall biosynthesis